jgi:2-polyprenyl-3-methyl-5-hydroxy-6-metoxy-1,4-benzoquinol methylase
VNPIESTKTLIQEGPELGDYPPYLRKSSNLEHIEGSWEQPLIEEYLRELGAKEANAQAALSHITDFTKRSGPLLDIGCFCGVFLNVASRAGWDCYGIEPLIMPAIYARGHYKLRVVTDTLQDETYPSEFFDVVTMFQVLEHLIHPERELERIRRILRPGGLLVVEVPNIDTLTVKLLRSKHRHFVQDHVSFFSAKTLSLLSIRMGFKVRMLYYPARVMSFYHFTKWMERYSGISSSVIKILPRRFLEGEFRIKFGDIVTMIAQKANSRTFHVV